MSRDDAMKILDWIRTDVGQDFFNYIEQQKVANLANLVKVGEPMDLHRAQGRQQQLEEIYNYFRAATMALEREQHEQEEQDTRPQGPSPLHTV